MEVGLYPSYNFSVLLLTIYFTNAQHFSHTWETFLDCTNIQSLPIALNVPYKNLFSGKQSLRNFSIFMNIWLCQHFEREIMKIFHANFYKIIWNDNFSYYLTIKWKTKFKTIFGQFAEYLNFCHNLWKIQCIEISLGRERSFILCEANTNKRLWTLFKGNCRKVWLERRQLFTSKFWLCTQFFKNGKSFASVVEDLSNEDVIIFPLIVLFAFVVFCELKSDLSYTLRQ